jgi:hypothetical protein
MYVGTYTIKYRENNMGELNRKYYRLADIHSNLKKMLRETNNQNEQEMIEQRITQVNDEMELIDKEPIWWDNNKKQYVSWNDAEREMMDTGNEKRMVDPPEDDETHYNGRAGHWTKNGMWFKYDGGGRAPNPYMCR